MVISHFSRTPINDLRDTTPINDLRSAKLSVWDKKNNDYHLSQVEHS